METPKDIATVMQIFTPIGARYLFPDKKKFVSYRRFSWGLPFHARPTRFRKL